MKIQAVLPVWGDSYNSYPPDLKVEISDEYVTLILSDDDREITIKKPEFTALVQLINIGGVGE